MLVGFELADAIGRAILSARGLSGAGSPVSGVPVAIVLGLLIHNLLGVPAAFKPGLKFCTTTVLRLGIVLVGIKLSLLDVLRLGVAGVPVVIAGHRDRARVRDLVQPPARSPAAARHAHRSRHLHLRRHGDPVHRPGDRGR